MYDITCPTDGPLVIILPPEQVVNSVEPVYGKLCFKSDGRRFELFERGTPMCVASCTSPEAITAAWRLLDRPNHLIVQRSP